ncbi:MAG: hypothetical protein KUG77_04650 [Nannocystaceae bacterium]|nr:hypothetical protein [Nannocystaceae bacterium]
MRRTLAQLACAALVWTSGCLTHRAHQWERTDVSPQVATGGSSLVIVGDPGAPGRTPATVARGISQTLAAERSAGRKPVLVWLGDNLLNGRGRLECAATSSTWTRPGVEELARVVRSHTQSGGAAFTLPGETAYRCGARESLRTDPDHPATQPGVHYVVDLLASGATRIASTCNEGTCTALSQSLDETTAQLVFVDLTPWIAGARPAQRDEDLRSLDALMTALEDNPGPPRILVANYPVEAAGFHGDGGGDPDSTVHMLAPPVGRALAAGVFVGTIAGHDRATYASRDITDGTIRGDRVFLPHAVFQVVSGAASTPDVRRGWRRLRFNSSLALVPERYTPRPGYAVLHLGESSAATLYAYRAGRWQTAIVPVTLRPAERPRLVDVPSTNACLRCPELPYNER